MLLTLIGPFQEAARARRSTDKLAVKIDRKKGKVEHTVYHQNDGHPYTIHPRGICRSALGTPRCCACLAHLVEHLFRKQVVRSSNLRVGLCFIDTYTNLRHDRAIMSVVAWVSTSSHMGSCTSVLCAAKRKSFIRTRNRCEYLNYRYKGRQGLWSS